MHLLLAPQRCRGGTRALMQHACLHRPHIVKLTGQCIMYSDMYSSRLTAVPSNRLPTDDDAQNVMLPQAGNAPTKPAISPIHS